ncbi:MAG: cation-translocating P-type ATPase [Anaerolineales bacterium]|nr:cation-translocating P-type ATPase [Anaerolineales bacterium]
MKTWHQLDIEKTLAELKTDLKTGLSTTEAKKRQQEYGPNQLIERGMKSPWQILLDQFTEIMVVILIIAAVISVLLHETTDAIVILIIVILNAALGFSQEYRAEKAIAALKRLSAPKVKVRRDGHLHEIPARELVPGDIVQLDAGDAVAADCRLIEAINLRVQEAVLTGESEPVEKHTRPILEENLSIGDQRNMVFMGTVTTYGRGLAVVVRTGMQTELGKIADMLQSVEQESTPLQKRLKQLGKGLALAALAIVVVIFILGLLRGEPLRLMFMTAIGMAVAVIPEGLPAVVTIALALGAQRMLQRNALIRKLPAVETLGSVTTICSDKTGTLTENRMTVTVVDVAGNRVDFLEKMKFYSPTVSEEEKLNPLRIKYPEVSLMLEAGALCNDAVIEKEFSQSGGYQTVGDPTEGALVIAAARAGLWKDELEELLPRVSELPFDSERKMMTTVHRLKGDAADHFQLQSVKILNNCGKGAAIAFTKGAVDSLLQVSTQVWTEGKSVPLDEEWRKRIHRANEDLAKQGVRVLGVAFRIYEDTNNGNLIQPREEGLTFVGLFGMIDPARPEVRDAVATSMSAGVRPIMITGDHPLTAAHIARQLGIGAPFYEVISGKELEEISIEELKAKLERVSIFARVSPAHKMKIVEALQQMGEIVAMTGDGVNDAPALKKADIGVAMGITGTDVSKEASEMVLLDDNFATIVAAIEEGRRIYDNIRKFIQYTLTSNAGEIWVMLLGPFFGLSLPLTPLQILWVNLVTDGLPGLALTVEPAEPDTMRRKPYPPNENIFGRGLVVSILWIGILMGLTSLLAGIWAYQTQRFEVWQTMVFTTLTLAQMGNVLAIRSNHYTLRQIGLLSNKPLLGAVLLTFVLQMAVIYLPFLQSIFKTVPLSPQELIVSFAFSIVVFLAVEFVKWFRFQRRTKGKDVPIS